MNRTQSSVIAIAIAGSLCMLAQAGAASAQTASRTESGDSLYRTYCASCHGPTATGDGPVAAFLKVPPANLAQIAKRNNGVFPSERVHQVIDGREIVKTHGDSQMPIWGDAFSKTTSASDVESVTAKIKALVEHLASIQEKAAN
ncbi:MAG: c-type cytochrome [Vicinamibacteraceae bacterium]